MKILYGTSFIDLRQHLNCIQPVIVACPPFSGSLRIRLQMELAADAAIVSIGKEAGKTRPRYLDSSQLLPKNFLTIIQQGGEYIVLFCLSHAGITAKLKGNKEGIRLCVRGESNRDLSILVCTCGTSLSQTVRLAMEVGLKRVNRCGKMKDDKPPVHRWFKTLGWESDGAFGVYPSHDKIISAVWALRREGIQPGHVLIGKGWQQTEFSKGKEVLSSFEADSEKFPMGLSGLVQELQRAGVHHVGVAHPILAGEGGVCTALIRQYQLISEDNPHGILGYDLGKTFQFYYDFYRSLGSEGITFTRVNEQVQVEEKVDHPARLSHVFSQLQAAIQASSSLHFETPHLNEDCIAGENLFHWAAARIAVPANSLDQQTLPRAKKAIRDLLTNTRWMQNFMHADFGSWPTYYPHSGLLAVLHALSGGLNTICDPSGKTGIELLKKCMLPSGRLLLTDVPLQLCPSSFFTNPLRAEALYQAFTFKGETGILALFHLARKKKPLQERVSAAVIEGLAGEQFAVYSHTNGYLGVFDKDECFMVTVKQNEADVLTFAPVQRGVALLGCYLFYVLQGPIQKVTDEGESMHISAIAASPMLMYSERRVMDIKRNGKAIPWDYDEDKKLLVIDSRQSRSEIPSVYTVSFD